MPTCYEAAVFTVALVYCVWRAYAQACRRREWLLRRRVAYMLWAMAEADDRPRSLTGPHAEGYGYD